MFRRQALNTIIQLVLLRQLVTFATWNKQFAANCVDYTNILLAFFFRELQNEWMGALYLRCAVLPEWLSSVAVLQWHPRLEEISWYDANIMPPFQDLTGNWVLERFRHVAMRVCGVQQRFLLRRDPSARIGVCDPSARIGGGSLWTRRNLISLDPLMLLGNSVLFSCELNPFDSISTLAVWSSKPFFAIR